MRPYANIPPFHNIARYGIGCVHNLTQTIYSIIVPCIEFRISRENNVHSRHKADQNKSRKVCYQQGMNINNFRS